MLIDTHAHVYPAEYLDLLERCGTDSSSTAVARNLRADSNDTDIGARLYMMDAAGVQMQVLSASPQLPQLDRQADAAAAARLINDTYAALITRYPGRFLAYAATPLPHIDAAIEEAGRALDQLGFVGVTLTTLVAGRSLADPSFEPFYAELNRRGAILYIHPTGCAAQSPLIRDFGLTWVIGAPIEDTLAILHLLKADIPARYPHIRFHIAHLGGELTFMMQRIEDNFRHWGAFPRSPRKEVARMWFDTANFHGPALRCAVDTLGADRYLLGSDYPYFQDDLYTRAVTYVQTCGLSTSQVRAILEGNAAALYGLD